MADGFEIVAAGLLVTNVRVNRRVARGARQVLAFAEGNVLVVRVLVAFGKPEVDDVDVVLRALCPANQEIVRFDISVDNAFLVNFLDSLDLHS